MDTPPDTCWRFHHYRLLPSRRLLLEGEGEANPVKLGSRAFDMLLALVERHDRVVTKHELMDLVWPALVVEENNLQVQVLALRKLLGHGAIATIPGRGYRFTVPLTMHGPAPAAAASPAEPQPAREGNLPVQAQELLGRANELRELQGLIDSHAVVTVTGAGGIGKTRLAQGAAAERALHEAVWWVELAPLADPALVPAAVGQALGLRLDGNADATAAVAQALQGKAALLVLDNAEHLLDGVAAFVVALRERAAGVKLLVTSQEVMRGLDEQVFRPGPLALPASDDLVAVRASGAVELFIARARQADPRFTLGEDNRAAVADICRRLDGIPLAIELAAARVPLLGVEGLRQRLDERFQVLTAGARAVMRRHQTLRAALEWSHGLLDEPERVVFRRLGVFAGGFTLDAAQAVAADEAIDGWDVLEHLGALVDKSLVVAEGGGGGDRLPRYRLLETSKLYALERLAEAGETAAVLLRHAGHCTTLAEAFDSEATRHGQAALALERLDAERGNLLNALAWCSGTGSTAPAGLRLAAALRYFWLARGLAPTGLAATRLALERTAGLPGDTTRCKALISAAQLLESMNRMDEIEPLAQELRTLGAAIAFAPATAAASLFLGRVATERGDWVAATTHFETALAVSRSSGNVNHEGNALSGLCSIAQARQRLDEAAALVEQLVALRRRAGQGYNLAVSLLRAAWLAICRAQLDAAAGHLAEAEPWVRGAGSRLLAFGWYGLTGSLAAARERWAVAVHLLACMLRVRGEDGVRPDEESVACERADLDRARQALGDLAFDAAWAAGTALTHAQAMDLAARELGEPAELRRRA
jgi:predicted ATPase/DNA-binding winged helix-turn-helix (wHTH) protein